MKRPMLIRLGVLTVLLAAVAWTFVQRTDFDVAVVENWVRGFGLWAPLAFAALYVIATVLFLPGSILTIVAGALFGPFWGTLYSLAGATVGATAAFLISRYLASEWVVRKAGGRLQRLIAGVEAEGWRFVAFTRLVPLFPFNLLNYALGLTRIPLSHYVLASLVCMLPGGFAYTYLGYAGREAATGGERWVEKGLVALALVATVAFLPRFIGRLRSRS